jgi:CRISPR/Cas system-associated exonuclease Cas4 (RecB family)
MTLSVRPTPYIIPEYSLTGDLLSYLTCGLQYRYQNKGSLPPSTPVQMWFGEFIHGVMEEAYLRWVADENYRQFPWDWNTRIRGIELDVHSRLRAKGLYPPPQLFCPYQESSDRHGMCGDSSHPHKLLASRRADAAINTWGPHLFPLINEAEVKLKGLRRLPRVNIHLSRAEYFAITGVVDVISSVNLRNAPLGNLILHYIQQNGQIRQYVDELESSEFEIIIDYKGMRRPHIHSESWKYHMWQVLTYAWLRSLQPGSKPVVAGIIFYLNELEPSRQDITDLRDDVVHRQTDVMPRGTDFKVVMEQIFDLQLSGPFREQRSIRLIPVNRNLVESALREFEQVVCEIEQSVSLERHGNGIMASWKTRPDEKTCVACDFKTYCPNADVKVGRSISIP